MFQDKIDVYASPAEPRSGFKREDKLNNNPNVETKLYERRIVMALGATEQYVLINCAEFCDDSPTTQ
jgi:hypothetical protein